MLPTIFKSALCAHFVEAGERVGERGGVGGVFFFFSRAAVFVFFLYFPYGRMYQGALRTVEQLQGNVQGLETQLAAARQQIAAIEQTRKEEEERGTKIKALLVKTKRELTEARQAATDHDAGTRELQMKVSSRDCCCLLRLSCRFLFQFLSFSSASNSSFSDRQVEERQQQMETAQLAAAEHAAAAAATEMQLRARVAQLTETLDSRQQLVEQLTRDLSSKTSMMAALQTEFQAYKVLLESLWAGSHVQVRAQSVLKQKQEAAPPVNVDELKSQVKSPPMTPPNAYSTGSSSSVVPSNPLFLVCFAISCRKIASLTSALASARSEAATAVASANDVARELEVSQERLAAAQLTHDTTVTGLTARLTQMAAVAEETQRIHREELLRERCDCISNVFQFSLCGFFLPLVDCNHFYPTI